MTGAELRLEEIMEVILAIAANDFTRRASVGDGGDVLDGIAAGLNMLAEEADRQRRTEAEFRARLLRSERLAAIGTLAAGVAHEINNPAAFLLGNFAALETHAGTLRADLASARSKLDAETASRMDAVVTDVAEIARVGHEGVERIANIVRGLRNFARIEADTVGPVRLDAIAEQACVLASREISHRARLIKSVAAVPEIIGERTKLTQLVTNLLLNAAQALDERGPAHNEVELSIGEAGDAIVLRVRDTGRGIPEELRGRVFEPFFTTKSEGMGTGLGLSISADIARQHGGELRFSSVPGGGTTFELVLPKRSVLAAPPTRAPPAVPAAARRQRILFIDDEEQVLRCYQRMLAKTHDVELAVGGEAALALLAKDTSFDAVICDLLMPEVDGAAVFEWMEAHAPQLTKRLLFCSGGAFTSRGAAFAETQRGRLLDKPLTRAALVTALGAIVTAPS